MGVPSSSYYTEESRRFMEELLKIEKGTQNGGIYANKSGYHNTRKANDPDDYSVRDSVDQRGPNDKAAGYDWTFPDAQSADYDRIKLYTDRLQAAWDRKDPRVTPGWREALGQSDYDGYAEGYDFRYHSQRTPDSSHLWHIHFSETREYVTSWDNKLAMLSVLRGESLEDWEEGEMALPANFDRDWATLIFRMEALIKWYEDVRDGPVKGEDVWPVREIKQLRRMDEDFVRTMAFRMEALVQGLDVVRDGPSEGEPVWVVQALRAIGGALIQPEPQDALREAIDRLDAAVLAYVESPREQAEI